jgi:hypothetical protein
VASVKCSRCRKALPWRSAFCPQCGLALAPSNWLKRVLARAIVGVLVTILGGIVLVMAIVALAVPTSRSAAKTAERNQREAGPLSRGPFAVAPKSSEVPAGDAVEAAPTVKPPSTTPAPESSNMGLALLPPNELALRTGRGWLDNGCFACDIQTDSNQSRWVVQEMTVRVTVFRANRGGVESRLCPIHSINVARGEVYTMSYSAQPALYLQPGDRWEWKIVEARGYPIIR